MLRFNERSARALRDVKLFNSSQSNKFEDLRWCLLCADELGSAVALFLGVDGNREIKKWRWFMKFQKIIRGQVVLMRSEERV